MTLLHGRNVRVYVNGSDISGDLNTVTPISEQDLNDITTFGHVGYSSYPGLGKDSVTMDSIFNTAARAVAEALIQNTATGYGMMVAYGNTSGQPAYATGDIILKSNAMKTVVSDVNRASMAFETLNYPFENCILLSEGLQAVGVASTGDGTAINNASASATTGGAAYLQVMSIVGGILTVHVEQSSTGAFALEEATTCTFAAASSSETQRIAITSQIEQYARVSWAATPASTASTASFVMALKRY